MGMNVQSPQARYTLPAGALLKVTGARGHKLVAERGVLLVSMFGEAGDIELPAGGCAAVPTRALVIVEAMEDAVLRIAAPEPGALMRALHRLMSARIAPRLML